MKLTPEQQVFLRYGYVKAWLQSKILEARSYARRTYGENYDKLTPEERADCRKQCQIEFLIQRVRDRRAACRAFMVSNDCSKCIHHLNKSPDGKCGGCKWDISYKIVKSRWEPRKEGES